MNHAQPQTRIVREHEQAEGRPQPRLIRVREHSAFSSSPRQQTRQQSVRVLDQGTASTVRGTVAATTKNNPQTDLESKLASAVTSPLAEIGREFEQPTNCRSHRIAVAILPLIRFPVHIRTISANVLI